MASMGRGLGGIFRTSAGIDAKGGVTLPADSTKAAKEEGLAVRKNFLSKLMGTMKGKGGLIGMAVLAAAAVTGAIIYAGFNEDAKESAGKAVGLMANATLGVIGEAGKYATIGMTMGLMGGPIGMAIGAALGGLVGAVIGFISLSDADKENFGKGLSLLWDTITSAFGRGIADLIQSLPDWAIPDSLLEWANKHGSTTKEKISSEEKVIAYQDEKVEKDITRAQSYLPDAQKLTKEQIEQIKNITSDNRAEVTNQIKKIAGKDLNSNTGLNPIVGAITGRNRARETLRLIKAESATGYGLNNDAVMGDTLGVPEGVAKHTTPTSAAALRDAPPSAQPGGIRAAMAMQPVDVMGDTLGIPEGVAKYTTPTNANKAAAQKIMTGGIGAVLAMQPVDVMGDTLGAPEGVAKHTTPTNTNKAADQKIMNRGTDQNYSHSLMGDDQGKPAGIVDSVIRSAETAIGNAAAEVAGFWTSISTFFGSTPVVKEQTTNLAALVGAASASQASATNVIMIGGDQGPPAATSGTTVNNNTTSVQSSTNNSLYSLYEDNRAAAAHVNRFGAT